MQKGEKRKAEILQVASTLFAQKGYRKTTLNDIIGAVGCSKGSFYHHFESKLQVLQAIAEQHIHSDWTAYAAQSLPAGIAKLNRLLYYACPFRPGEEEHIAAQLALGMQQEGAVISAHIRDARKAGFFAALVGLLGDMKEMGLAHYHNECLPELLWDAHAAFLEAMMQESCRLVLSGGTPNSRLIEMLRAARFQWERLIDLPYGSVEIIPADEMLAVLGSACSRVQAEEEQLRFDAGFAAPCQQLGKPV